MNKEFLDVSIIRNNALAVSKKIHQDKFMPTVIYVSLRGGAVFGNVISEYFKLASPTQSPPLYAAVVAHSYVGVRTTSTIHIDGWTYHPKFLRRSDKILLIDDIFDSGGTINHIMNILLSHGISRECIKVIVHDYKKRIYQKDHNTHYPDYYCRELKCETPENDFWIHYLSHELDGLTEQEVKKHYPSETWDTIINLLKTREKNINTAYT